jgi:hypothetical protein
MKRTAILLVSLLMIAAAAPHAQSRRYTLLDVVVFGAFLEVDMAAYTPDIRSLLQQHVARSKAYRPRPRPARKADPLMDMVFAARENYERRLVAAANRPGVDRLAQQYVDELKPCYEWEGMHDCPEAEAKFAQQYLANNPNSPFREFLPLLAANRWLCTAEGYDFEERPREAARSRRAAAAPLATALKAQSVLLRTAAQELRARNKCFLT